jgi:hypothetical protein
MNDGVRSEPHSGTASRRGNLWTNGLLPVGLVAGLNFALHLIAIRGFGIFRDELYYVACSDHLALGYVDQPPLSILLLKLVRIIFGDSLSAIRILPALGSAAFVLLAGLIAREIGGKRFAMFLAAAAAFATTGNMFLFHIYSMNFLDLLFWETAILILMRIIKSGRARLWLLFGLVVGLGFENKISVLILVFGLAVGILLTENRHVLKSRYLWLGAGLAALLILPYVYWNATHGGPALEFMRNARLYKNVQNTLPGFLLDQVLFNNPLTFFLWVPGLAYFFFHKNGRPWRLFGWMYLSLFALLFLQHGKDYYMAGAYPVLFAGGAILVESWTKSGIKRWLRPTFVTLLIAASVFFAPMALPILSVQKTADFQRMIGYARSQERDELGVFPQHFADEFGWPDMVATFAGVFQKLRPEEQAHCLIFVRNYGEAAAVDFFGKNYGLPKATCGHNNYWLWGPSDWEPTTAIVLGVSRDVQKSRDDLTPHFNEVVLAGTTSVPFGMPYENGRPIFIVRGFKHSLRDLWPRLKSYS